jgi:hypothetical protein
MPRINILDEFEALGTELEPGGSANVAPAYPGVTGRTGGTGT